MATIREVAAAAGVSPTTVSHVLNNRGRVAEDTRSRVLAIASKLDYQANAHAQQLVTNRSRIIAIQMPDLSDLGLTASSSLPLSAYFLELINGAAHAANRRDYAMIVTPAGGSLNVLNSFAISGAIVVDPQGDEAIFASNARVVTIGVPAQQTQHSLWVDNDHAQAAWNALDHFSAHGRRRPAIVADRTGRSYVNDVQAGYKDWVNAHDTSEVIMTTKSLDEGSLDATLAQLISLGIDAIYASSDDLALGLLDAATRAGQNVPDDIFVASAVDSRSLTFTTPQISATDLFPRRTGEAAAEILIETIETNGNGDDKRVIPTHYVSRASTGNS